MPIDLKDWTEKNKELALKVYARFKEERRNENVDIRNAERSA